MLILQKAKGESLFVFLVMLCLPMMLSAQLTASGSEFVVNTTVSDAQKSPAIAMDSAGNYMVVWEANGVDGSGYGVYGQRYLAGGIASGSEFLINTTTSMDQRLPDVGMDQTGRSVVVWMDEAEDGSGWGIYAQRYDAAGATSGSEFRVNTTTSNHQKFPSIAMTTSGEYIISWVESATDGSSFQIKAKRYDLTMGTLSGEVDVDTASSDFVGYPRVAIDESGNFAVAWQEENIDGAGLAVSACILDNNLTPTITVNPFQVNTTTTGNQYDPAIAMDADGNMVIAWISYGQDGDAEGIYAQKIHANGSFSGSEFAINQTTTGPQVEPFLGITSEGNFKASWTSFDASNANPQVYIRELLSDQSGSETQISSVANGNQLKAKFAQSQNNKSIAIVWQDGLNASSSSKDGSDFAVMSKGFTGTGDQNLLFPVEYVFLSASAVKEGVQLTWRTSLEVNNTGFEIQRYDKQSENFVNIDWVDGKGDTEVGHTYKSLDPDVIPGQNYLYRLKQIDFDGKYSFSNQVSVRFSENIDPKLLIYPNPLIQDDLHLWLQGVELRRDIKFEIYDRLGRKVFSREFSKEDAREEIILSLQELSEGYYSLFAKGGSFVLRKEFFKQ